MDLATPKNLEMTHKDTSIFMCVCVYIYLCEFVILKFMFTCTYHPKKKKKPCVYIRLSVCLLEKESNIVILRKLDRRSRKNSLYLYVLHIYFKIIFFGVSEVCTSHSYVTF